MLVKRLKEGDEYEVAPPEVHQTKRMNSQKTIDDPSGIVYLVILDETDKIFLVFVSTAYLTLWIYFFATKKN